MSENKFLKSTCAQCGGHIEFPADGIGMTIPCPHCGWETELTLAAPEETSARSPRSLKWMIAGAIILIVGVVGVVVALFLSQRLLQKRAQRITIQATGRSPTQSLSGTAAKPSIYLINNFSVSDVKIEKARGSTLVYALGTVKNETEKQLFNVTVELDVLDSSGNKIGLAKDYRDTLEPRSVWTFRALLLQKRAASARVTSVHEKQ